MIVKQNIDDGGVIDDSKRTKPPPVACVLLGKKCVGKEIPR
jgi:hypothetical protein